jgi:hypothetical protein
MDGVGEHHFNEVSQAQEAESSIFSLIYEYKPNINAAIL